ncbi:MAG: hypothetical protein C5B49_15450 [Bdellovibrio sp.]|nr:MAG: hypothetical protein C5B49_15450 [Bdellovibrio sp.]
MQSGGLASQGTVFEVQDKDCTLVISSDPSHAIGSGKPGEPSQTITLNFSTFAIEWLPTTEVEAIRFKSAESDAAGKRIELRFEGDIKGWAVNQKIPDYRVDALVDGRILLENGDTMRTQITAARATRVNLNISEFFVLGANYVLSMLNDSDMVIKGFESVLKRK